MIEVEEEVNTGERRGGKREQEEREDGCLL